MTPANRIRNLNTENHFGRKAAIIAGLVFLIVTAALFFFRASLFGYRAVTFPVTFPGSGTPDFTTEGTKATEDMHTAFKKIMTQETGAIEYYKISEKSGTIPAEVSGKLLFKDQVELLGFFTEQGDLGSFNRLNEWVGEKFKTPDGLFVKEIDRITMNYAKDKISTSIADQVHYCRILMEAYSRFGQPGDLELVRSISQKIYPFCKDQSILPPEMTITLAMQTPTPDFTATPEPKPTALPTPDPSAIRTMGVLDLSSIDLYALKLLTTIEPGWSLIYENCLKLIKNSAIDNPVPFHQAGYDIAKTGYVPYLSANPEFILEDQVRMLLHLEEVSESRESTFSYLRQQLFNTKTFYQAYQILTGTSVTESESVTGYALMARIARIRKDKELYDLCIARITWNTATNPESEIAGLPFTTLSDGRILAFAKDSIAALKANK